METHKNHHKFVYLFPCIEMQVNNCRDAKRSLATQRREKTNAEMRLAKEELRPGRGIAYPSREARGAREKTANENQRET